MRLRSFVAADMPSAIAQVRAELGAEAIIVSTETTREGVKIVAAADPPDDFAPNASSTLGNGQDGDVVDIVHETLLGHGVPRRLIERLVDAAFLVGCNDPAAALAGALTASFGFRPLDHAKTTPPLLLIGAPGAGKTMTVVKLAARHVMAGRRVRLVTTDTVRAGALAQLEAFARLLGIDCGVAESPRELAKAVRPNAPGELILVDTAGVNHRAGNDMAELAELIDAARGEPVLVMAAGGDVEEASEQASAMAEFAPGRLVATRVDTVRRLGSILAAADHGRLALAEYGSSAAVANGLLPFDAKTLSRLLLPEAAAVTSATVMGGRAS
jgi:flagellar biosynthesis protein FlhF